MINRKTFGSIVSYKKDRFGEKCGVIGVWRKDKNAPFSVRRGLSTLQHRGQESAGISIYNPQKGIITYKGMGLIPNVITADILERLGVSQVAIGHNRYSTTGNSSVDNAQPITLSKNKYQISIGHNGNIPDCGYLGEEMGKCVSDEKETSDTYLVAEILLERRTKNNNWDDTLMEVLPKIKGAFCFVILTEDGTLYGARDPYGIRPFCLARYDEGWLMASESVAADLTGAEFLRDILPGEIIKIDPNGEATSFFFGKTQREQNCIFEYIYFSRPDSFENGIRIRQSREECGRLLGKRIFNKKIKAEAVVPVFDSGYPAAKGVAKELNLPIIDAITVSHYIGRTFIQPGNENRKAAVGGKHNIVPDEIRGKKIIVVDDSAVRLTTSRRLQEGLKDSGAKEVYMVFASPPVVNQCDLGIDMKSKKELPASQWEKEPIENIEKNIAKLIGAESVVYLPMEEMVKALGKDRNRFYHFPFGGLHPIREEKNEFSKMKRKINGKPKITIFASGEGSNLENIIEKVKKADIKAEVASVIISHNEANAKKRAELNSLNVEVIPFEGSYKNTHDRSEYENKLIKHITHNKPDIIVLAGWMMVLGPKFLEEMEQLEIPVLNLHPALLTSEPNKEIPTSRGMIPVLRGTKAISEAFEKKLPVSGVSVHQVLSKYNYDIGPVIIKEEVRIRKEDTSDIFEKRIHDAEYRVLPAAIKRVIHLMEQGIDIIKGEFIW